jgi:hypothetical protein
MSVKKNRAAARHSQNFAEKDQHSLLADLEAFEEFKAEILPVLRREIAKGSSAEEIYSKFEAHLAARAVTIAMTEMDSARAMGAIREALDRSKGKAVERREVTNKYANLTDDELAALARSKRKEIEDDTETPEH